MLTYNVLNEYVEKMKKNDLAIVSTTDNIKTLTTNDISKLRAGDIVLKEDSTGKHAYIVSYKKDGTGICMTYSDATYTETISYDYNSVTKEWVYNSMDSTELVSKSYVDSLMSGALKRLIVETLPTEDIDTNTIYMVLDSQASTQGNVYNEYLYINNAWELIGTTAVASSGGEVFELYQSGANNAWKAHINVVGGIPSNKTFAQWLYDKGFTDANNFYPCDGLCDLSVDIMLGVCSNSNGIAFVYTANNVDQNITQYYTTTLKRYVHTY